jgi:hypothetical protein
MTLARLRWLAAFAAVGAALTFLLATAAFGGQSQRMTMPMTMTMPMRHHAGLSPAAVALRENMRKLWEDHITWTRLTIVSFDANLPDLQATLGRLLRNQTDIGNAIKPYYGAAAGKQLTSLLRSHILIAADVLAAAKKGDAYALSNAQQRWEANADDIARFLTRANPRSWPLSMTRSMMRKHLKLTTDEAVAHLQGNWSADIAAYDAVHREILQMADMLSSGIVHQFPGRFRQ